MIDNHPDAVTVICLLMNLLFVLCIITCLVFVLCILHAAKGHSYWLLVHGTVCRSFSGTLSNNSNSSSSKLSPTPSPSTSSPLSTSSSQHCHPSLRPRHHNPRRSRSSCPRPPSPPRPPPSTLRWAPPSPSGRSFCRFRTPPLPLLCPHPLPRRWWRCRIHRCRLWCRGVRWCHSPRASCSPFWSSCRVEVGSHPYLLLSSVHRAQRWALRAVSFLTLSQALDLTDMGHDGVLCVDQWYAPWFVWFSIQTIAFGPSWSIIYLWESFSKAVYPKCGIRCQNPK